MTEQEFSLAVDKGVEDAMASVTIRRIDRCHFSNDCPVVATHVSSFDGTPLCVAHMDAYMHRLRDFFEVEGRKTIARFIEQEAKDSESHEDRQEDLQRAPARDPFEPGDFSA